MFLAGDEFLNTQRGTNNPFNQDNETTWLDWSLLEKHSGFHRFFREMITFRKRHKILGASRFWRDRILWRGVSSEPDRSYHSHTLAVLLEESDDSFLYVIVSAYWESLKFELPRGYGWTRVIDTALPSPLDIVAGASSAPTSQAEDCYLTAARCVVVFEGRR